MMVYKVRLVSPKQRYLAWVSNSIHIQMNTELWYPSEKSMAGQILKAFCRAKYFPYKGYKLSGEYIEYLGRQNHCLDPMRALRRLRSLSQVKLKCERNSNGSKDYYLKVLRTNSLKRQNPQRS